MTYRRVSFAPLGVETLVPPRTSRPTLDVGVCVAPRGLCGPCRLLFGSNVETAGQGALTGPC